MAYINHYYFYIWHREWGPTFWKPNAYAPYPIWLWLNEHEWAKRQHTKAGIAYETLDNGFRGCGDPATLQRTCDRLGAQAVKSFFWKWFQALPCPFTRRDLRSGYVYELAFRQFEVAETIVFDRPQSGRAWFEGVIRDHLDIGRPHQNALVFNRRVNAKTPGTFRTRVIVRGVDPYLTCCYKSSRIKQYFKMGRALRTETVISNTRDFGIGRRVTAENFQALRAVGQSANQRLHDAETADANPATDVVTFERVTRPSLDDDGLYAPSLRFGDSRVMAVFSALTCFSHLIGFTNPQLTRLTESLLNARYTRRQATYDLRRLRRNGIVIRLPGRRRYQVTEFGRRVAVLFTKAYRRVLLEGLSLTSPDLPPDLPKRHRLASAWRRFDREMDNSILHGLTGACQTSPIRELWLRQVDP